MIRKGFFGAIIIILFTALVKADDLIGHQLILRFKASVVAKKTEYSDDLFTQNILLELNTQFDCKNISPALQGPPYIPAYILIFADSSDLNMIAAAYRATQLFEYVEPHYAGELCGLTQQAYTPNDQYYNRQWWAKNDGSFSYGGNVTAGADMELEAAWAIEKGDATVVVSVLDSGVKHDHPEFSGRIWSNSNEIPGNGIDDDGNGYIDDTMGWDFINADNIPNDDITFGHGTGMTSALAATGDNSIGYAGVDWNCSLMLCKVADNVGASPWAAVAAGVYYSVNNGADVINISIAGTTYSALLEEAIDTALAHDIPVVTSMGNHNSGITRYPAGLEQVIAVGATDPDDTRSVLFNGTTGGSNYGNHIDIVAPGNYIFYAIPEDDNDYNTLSGGTSIATPMVSGTISLMLARNPNLTVSEIKDILYSTAEDTVGRVSEDMPGWDIYHGHGRLNTFKAVSQVWNVGIANEIEINTALYPNPAQGELYVSGEGIQPDIVVYDLVGHIVGRYSDNTTGHGPVTIDLSGLPSGSYYCRINTNSGTKVFKRFSILR